jgi:hypothetical protein
MSNRPRERPTGQPPGDSPSGDGDEVTQLAQLAALHKGGALTDEEFLAAKQKIIGAD